MAARLTRTAAAVLLAIACLVPAARATAQPPPPRLTAPVNDFARVIDEQSARELDRRIRSLQQATGDVVVVATVKTFQPWPDIKSYAVEMFENGGQGIGERGKDNGLLIVLALDDRKVGIEVGYALEAFVTDGYAGETIRQEMLPEFRAGQYGRGLLAGTTRIINRIAEERQVTLQDVPRSQPTSPPGFHISFPTILFILFLFMLFSRRRRGRRRHWGRGPWSGWNSGVGPFGGGFGGFGGGFGGGGFGGRGGGGFGGGGFGGFGGGRSGGGGASGGW